MKSIQVDPIARGLIFDIDGTLADTMPTHFEAFKKVLGKYGIEMTQEIFDSTAGVPVGSQMELFKETFNPENFDPETAAIEKEDEYFKSIDAMKPIDVVLDVLNDNYGKLPIACGTGGGTTVATKTLQVIGVLDKVDFLVSSDDVEKGKPAPDTFLRCAELMNIDPQYCQVFEDGQPGIDAAIAAGMMVIDIRKYV